MPDTKSLETQDTASSKMTVDKLKDEELLATLGYKQEFKRDFNWVQLLGLSFSINGIVQAVTAIMVYTLKNGGPVAMVWGWASYSVFLVIIALSMAELASAAPTSGGLYYWTFTYASPRFRNILSWVTGYCCTLNYMATACGAAYSLSTEILAAVTIATEGSYVPTRGHLFGVFLGLIIFQALIASLATRYIARLQPIFSLMNFLQFGALIIALPLATPSEFKNTASFALGGFKNLSTWPSAFAFFLSWLAPSWTMGLIDSSLHISEEVRQADVAVPRAMIFSTGFGCFLGFIFNIVLAFHMGTDTEALLNDPIGQPMAAIYVNSFGRRGALIAWSFVIITQCIGCINILTAASRQMFAFSRDGALPFSKYLYKVNKRTKTPVACVCALALGAVLLGLLTFAGNTAAGAVFIVAVVCAYISFSVPIAARLLGGQKFVPGPFSLGKWSIPVALVALVSMAFTDLILMFPSDSTTDAADMNYSSAVLVGVILVCHVYYYFPKYGGKHWFVGPVRTFESSSTTTETRSFDQDEKIL